MYALNDALVPPFANIERVVNSLLERALRFREQIEEFRTANRSPLLWGTLLYCTTSLLRVNYTVIEAYHIPKAKPGVIKVYL